jgi:hypothetical protein
VALTAASSYTPAELIARQRSVDHRAARATLRRQIARLEQELGVLVLDLWEAGRTRLPHDAITPATGHARVLSLGELELTRDGLIERTAAGRAALRRQALDQRRARAHLNAMLADPAGHRYHVVQRAALGEPSCGAYQVRPQFGLLGMLFGWWRVKLSSGCPLAVSLAVHSFHCA